jgi:hypothetical protein
MRLTQKIKLARTLNASPQASRPHTACCRRQPDHPRARSTAAKAPTVLALPRPRTLAIKALRWARVTLSTMSYHRHETARAAKPGLVGVSAKQRGPASLPALVL